MIRFTAIVVVFVCMSGCEASALPGRRVRRVEFVRVVEGATASRGEAERAIRDVMVAYGALGLGIEFKSRLRDVRVGFGPGLVADREAYFRRIERSLRAGVKTVVFVPMSVDGFQWGLAGRYIAVATLSGVNLRGEPRYWHGVNTAVHELGHLLGAGHDATSINVMHPNALVYVRDSVLAFPHWFTWAVRLFGFRSPTWAGL